MRTVDEIHELKIYYVDTLYSTVRSNQKEYIQFYDDTFYVPWIKAPMEVSRTGAGAELIDEPVEQLSAQKLIAYRPSAKPTNIAEESANKISKLINEDWLRRTMRQNPNPLQVRFKNRMMLGESWLHPVHNKAWVTEPFNKTGLPVLFLVPNPMIVYASPNENENGIPEDVIVFYERMPWVVKSKYPAWTNPKRRGDGEQRETVEWLEYWDKDMRYFEADGEVVLSSPNPYKFVPFIHKLSGFGKSSHEGKPEELIVGRAHKYRDLLKRDAAITSDVDSSFHLYANPTLEVQGDDAHEVPDNFDETYSFAAGNINKIPPGITVKRGVELLPEQQTLQWAYAIQATLGRKTPSVLTGAPMGETGRATDVPYGIAMRKYEGMGSTEADAWATAIGMALQMCDEMPNLMPDGISHKDIGKNYVVEVELRADAPLETARKSADGDYKQQNGIISWKGNLVKYQGFTSDEADEEIDEAIIDTLMRDPITLRLMALQNAREKGMEQEYLALEAEAQGGGQGGEGSQGGPPRNRNIKTARGKEEVDLSQEKKPVRMPPR